MALKGADQLRRLKYVDIHSLHVDWVVHVIHIWTASFGTSHVHGWAHGYEYACLCTCMQDGGVSNEAENRAIEREREKEREKGDR